MAWWLALLKGVLLALLAFSLLSPAAAYIDPGAGMSFVSGLGSMIVGLAALIVGGVAVTAKKWIGWVKGLFRPRKTGDRHPH